MNSMKDIYYMYMFLNPKIRPIAARHSKILKKRYGNDPQLNDLISMYSGGRDVTNTDVTLLLEKHKIDGKLKSEILSYYELGQNATESGTEIILDTLKKLISASLFEEIQNVKDPNEAMAYIRNYDYSFESGEISKCIKNSYSLGSLDIKKAREDLGAPIKSFLPEINNCFSIGGYIRNQLISIIAAPGNGKSLFCMNESSFQLINGYKVLYVAIGDLTQVDFATRMCSILLNVALDKVSLDIEKYWNMLTNQYGQYLKNFHVLYADPGTVSVDMLDKYFHGENPDRVDYTKEYNILYIDYDTNLMSTKDMYQKGEEIYNMGAAWSKIFDLVFMVGQPKIEYYEKEIIPQEGMSESSRKNQIIDVGITIGRTPNSINPVGVINMAKIRRYGFKTHFKYRLDVSGRFEAITSSTYNMLAHSDTLKSVDVDTQSIENQLNNQLEAIGV